LGLRSGNRRCATPKTFILPFQRARHAQKGAWGMALAQGLHKALDFVKALHFLVVNMDIISDGR
jgi:hypothetical protein